MISTTVKAEYFLENRLQNHVILCGSDFLTFGMQRVFKRNRLISGRDYILMSYDNFRKYLKLDDDWFRIPSITHPLEPHAAAVADMVEELIRRPDAGYYRTYVTPADEFVIRQQDGNDDRQASKGYPKKTLGKERRS